MANDGDISFLTFQSTLPSQGATHNRKAGKKEQRYFNPRSPHRERLCLHLSICRICRFQSTLPSQGATCCQSQKYAHKYISIHAPLTGSDWRLLRWRLPFQYFNPRSPHRERRQCGRVRRRYTLHFNPRSPHRERPDIKRWHETVQKFQSTLPSQGATALPFVLCVCQLFQSTLPSQGATESVVQESEQTEISIHAPLTGSDFLTFRRLIELTYFNPRSPHRERQQIYT